MATDHPKAEISARIARRKELIETSKKLIEETKNLVEQSHQLILIAMGHDAMGKANKTDDCNPYFFSTFSSSRTKVQYIENASEHSAHQTLIKQSLLRRQKGQCDNRWEVKTAPKCKNRICLQRISEVQVADVRNGTIAVAV